VAVMAFIGAIVVIGVVGQTVFICRSYGSGAVASLICLLLSMSCVVLGAFFPPVGLSCLTLLIACLICVRRTPKPGSVGVICIAALLVGMAGGVFLSLSRVERVRQYRETYPLVSVADRLNYETKATEDHAATSSYDAARFGPPPSGSPAWDVLKAAESQERSSGRRWALEQIHASTVEQFANAPGFGVARMMSVDDFTLENRRLPPISLPGSTEPYPSREHPDPLRDAALSFVRPAEARSALKWQLWGVHEHGLEDFFHPDDLGWVVDRDHVAGFVPHRFSNGFEFARLAEHPDLELRRLELVSLRRFAHPMVYMTNQQLPRMDELHNVPTRELDPFEAAALESLAKGENLCYVHKGSNVHAVGALRARNTCTKCHEVDRGALLGAFSYEFLSVAPRTKPRI
jgi:hypothetical protein